jgi:methyl-accepting chemotaxis protein
MGEMSKNLRKELITRSGKGTPVIVAIIVFYVLSLMSVRLDQLKAIGLGLAIVAPLLFLIYTYQTTRLNIRPITRVLDGIDTSVEALQAAERRALNMPYYILGSAIIWFSLGGLGVAGFAYLWGPLTADQAFYIIGSGVTAGAVAGVSGFYYAKEPMQEILVFLFDKKEVSGRPPFFVPLLFKLIMFFTIALGLISFFLGLLSLSTIKELVLEERSRARLAELKSVAEINAELPADMTSLCRADLAKDSISCRKGTPPSSEVSDHIASHQDSQAPFFDDGSFVWSWTGTDNGVLISAWPSIRVAELLADLKGYYLKSLLVVLLGGVGLGMMVARDIADPIRALGKNAAAIRAGDHDNLKISAGQEDETGIMARAFQTMTEELLERIEKNRRMLDGIETVVQSLSALSDELVGFVRQQAAANTEQSATAEETAATCEEMTATSKHIAENAGKVARLAESAFEMTQEGGRNLEVSIENFDEIERKMAEINDAVGRLSRMSEKIAGVVSIIDELQSQVELLSLNAGLEAAGAGEYGRRFGVVAEEVRRLSERTGEATSRIAEIVGHMTKVVGESEEHARAGDGAVREGRDKITTMMESFKRIMEAITETTMQMEEIDKMSVQQQTASDQMAQAVGDVRDTARDLSKEAEVLNNSMVRLNDIAQQLKSMLD